MASARRNKMVKSKSEDRPTRAKTEKAISQGSIPLEEGLRDPRRSIQVKALNKALKEGRGSLLIGDRVVSLPEMAYDYETLLSSNDNNKEVKYPIVVTEMLKEFKRDHLEFLEMRENEDSVQSRDWVPKHPCWMRRVLRYAAFLRST